MVIKIQMGFMILLMAILYLKIMVEFIFQRLSHLEKVLKKSTDFCFKNIVFFFLNFCRGVQPATTPHYSLAWIFSFNNS